MEQESWEAFLERLLERLNDMRRRGVKYNLTIMGGRHDEQTGADATPTFNVQELNPQR